MMRGVCGLALVVAAFGIIRADSSIFSGFLGCRFSLSVCRQNEECVDDRLFGSCQRLGEPHDTYQYMLSSNQLHELEALIGNLIEAGNTWDDLYTQCSLSNILLAFRQFRSYDPGFCDNAGVGEGALQDKLTDATVELLKSYLEDYYLATARQKQLADYPDYNIYNDEIPVEKKDEVVQVHKYLKSHKRDPFTVGGYPDVQSDYGTDVLMTRDYPDVSGVDYDTNDFLRDLSPEKLRLLEEYLGPLTPDGNDDVTGVGDGGDYMDKSYDEGVQSTPLNDDYAVLEPIDVGDAQILDQLLQGKVTVSDLSDDQISHLSKYVDGMLQPLRKYGTMDEVPMETNEDIPVEVLKEPPVAGADEDIESDPDDVRPLNGVKKELLDSDLLKSAQEADLNMEKKIHPNNPHTPTTTPSQQTIAVLDRAYIKVKPPIHSNKPDAAKILVVLERHLGLNPHLGPRPESFSDIVVGEDVIDFKVDENEKNLNASEVVRLTKGVDSDEFQNQTGFIITDVGIGEYQVNDAQIGAFKAGIPVDADEGMPIGVNSAVNGIHANRPRYFVLTFVLCGVILGIVLSVIAIYIVRRHLQSREKLAQLAGAVDGVEASNDYQDLCRQRMQTKSSEKPEPLHISSRVGSVSASEGAVRSPSSRSSTSSRSEEPVVSNMDISTGHIVLSYMEDHLKNKDRLDQEWAALCVYEAEPNSTSIAGDSTNMRKNKYSDVLPYDHSRVILTSSTNVSGSDYINASTITDHDPRNPAYICTQGPLPHTVADFWQMVWEQGSVVIVNLTKLTENGQTMCHRYWPAEGSDLYHIYEVHLVSEHTWCDEYSVRCFYLKNLQTNETRTVSQFHFVAWPDLGIPSSAKALLDFRRKVNKSYRGQNCPIVVQCSDGSGRSGCYCLLDMVLNRMSKGAKEIDIAATLEHIRDQRMLVVKTKEQFEFVLASVAEEVHAILKALPQ